MILGASHFAFELEFRGARRQGPAAGERVAVTDTGVYFGSGVHLVRYSW